MGAKQRSDSLLYESFEESWGPEHWAATAVNLRRAAEVLFSAYDGSMAADGEPINPEDMQLDKPATLLYGYAFENAVKGLLIKKLSLGSSHKFDSIWKGHDLRGLVAQTGTSASGEEGMLLDLLTAHILWAGKYPRALQFEGKHGFVLPEQYDHVSPHITEDMPPRTLDVSMRWMLEPLFNHLLDRIGGPHASKI